MLYMQNSEHHASALFSDATTDELLRMDAGGSLMADALMRLGFDVASAAILKAEVPTLTPAYMVCQKDRLVLDIKVVLHSLTTFLHEDKCPIFRVLLTGSLMTTMSSISSSNRPRELSIKDSGFRTLLPLCYPSRCAGERQDFLQILPPQLSTWTATSTCYQRRA